MARKKPKRAPRALRIRVVDLDKRRGKIWVDEEHGGAFGGSQDKLDQLMRESAKGPKPNPKRKKKRNPRAAMRNPVSRARWLGRAEKLHEAVSRGLRRSKGPPSKRQIAIEKAYQRAVDGLARSRRANPMAKARRRRHHRNPRQAAAKVAPGQASLFVHGGETYRPKGQSRPPSEAAAARTAAAVAVNAAQAAHLLKDADEMSSSERRRLSQVVYGARALGHGMHPGPLLGNVTPSQMSRDNSANNAFDAYLRTAGGKRWLKGKEGKAYTASKQTAAAASTVATKEAKKAVKAAKKAASAKTPAAKKAATKQAKKAATKAKKAVKKGAAAAVKANKTAKKKGRKVKASGGATSPKKKRKSGGSKKRKSGGSKKRKSSGTRKRSGRGHISAAHRAKMNAGRRRYWAAQKKKGGPKARLRRKLRAAIKAHPPMKKALRAFRKTNPRRRRRNPAALLVNPRKSRRRNPAMKRRRRNPGLGGVAMEIVKVAGPAVGAGAALGMLDVAIGSDKAPEFVQKHAKLVSILSRVGVGVGALVLLRNKPKYAIPIACAAFSGLGQIVGHKIAGGVDGGSLGMVAKEMSEMAAQDEEAFGLVLNEMSGMGLLAIQGFSGPTEDAANSFSGTEPLETDF